MDPALNKPEAHMVHSIIYVCVGVSVSAHRSAVLDNTFFFTF